jgi:hypothetical protein
MCRTVVAFFLFVFTSTSFSQTNSQESGCVPATQPITRFFKAENGVSADYLKLAKDGTYQVTAREHMGVELTEEGRWEQKGSLITLRPRVRMRGGKLRNASGTSYEGVEVEYKGQCFIAWKSDDAPGIAIPVEDTEQQLDDNPKGQPEYVFFKVTFKTYADETKQPYPFRHLRPDN